ncbi:hypothetical protein, partial [Herbinix luporum]|uniref:hypothetical protein n=1 Tax=Herbinix luporum TaxID=1679721 RepID=UPI001758D1F4
MRHNFPRDSYQKDYKPQEFNVLGVVFYPIVLECINITINTLQNSKTVSLDDDTTFSGSTFEAAPFDQSTIMGFIENNLKSNRYEDELFNHTIATVFELDSEAFVKMISD